jgi:TPR repeat protein
MKRTRAATVAAAEEEKSTLKSTLVSVLKEHTCPITGELMEDPVTAEDGHVYERSAIQKWFEMQPTQIAKSPMTGRTIGFRLYTNLQARNVIAKLVEAGACSHEEASDYKKRRLNQVALDKLYEEIEKNECVASMAELGYVYRDSLYGQNENQRKAFEWFKCAADRSHIEATTSVGICYLNGTGVEKNRSRGILYLSQGAIRGSEHAAAVLGWAFENGNHGFDVDPVTASSWYYMMASAYKKDSIELYRNRAKAHLEKYPYVMDALPSMK